MAVGGDEVETAVNCGRSRQGRSRTDVSSPLLSTMFFLLRPLSSLRYLGDRDHPDGEMGISYLSNCRSMYLMISLKESVLLMASPKPGVSTTVSLGGGKIMTGWNHDTDEDDQDR